MKVPGSVYIGKERKYLALYSYFPDVYRAAPPSLKNPLHVSHVKYGFGSFERGIDIFLLEEFSTKEVDCKRIVIVNRIENEKIKVADTSYNIRYEILKNQNAEFMDLVRQDIADFCRKKAANSSPGISYVDRIEPKTKIRRFKQKQLLMEGKQEYVPSCGLEANLDFSYGCISGQVNGFLDPFAECSYCYAIFNHKTFTKYVVDIDKNQLKDELSGNHSLNGKKPVKVLRLGKRTESGSKFTLDSLITTLETCLETGTRVVMPTKYLEFNKEIAGLLKRTNSVVLYSIGFDSFERGACSHSCTNEFRLEQAKKYHCAGINSIIYLLIDLPHAPRKREREVIKFAADNNMNMQLLSVRIPGKDVAPAVTGMSWDSLKNSSQNQLAIPGMDFEIGGYYNKAGTLVAQLKHPFWLNLVKKNKGNIRMCHHDEKETYCGRCFIDDNGFIIPTEKVDMIYRNIKRNGNWRRKSLIDKNLKLF